MLRKHSAAIEIILTLIVLGSLVFIAAFAFGQCDQSKWKNVYHTDRFVVLDSCKTVEGIIDHIQVEKDGDYHIRLKIKNPALLNEKNLTAQHGCLVLEIICAKRVKQADAKQTCLNYVNDVTVPKVGDKVCVTGAYVLDQTHKWLELHPVFKIEKI